MSAIKEHYHNEIEKQTRIMNKIQLQFKADTGLRPLFEMESEVVNEGSRYSFKAIPLKALPSSYQVCDDVRIPSPEYVAWLEEKVEAMQKLPTNNI
jgi:hypothetical protein